MTDLKNQRRMASDLLKCGVHRVRFDDRQLEDAAEAVTRSDIRKLIISGGVYKAQKRGNSRGRINFNHFQKSKGRGRGQGKRKGTFNARNPKKKRWIMTIRPIRRRLRSLRDKGKIDKHTYRTYYRKSKGGLFKDRTHLDTHLKAKKLIKKKKKGG